jgi:hypothetical protein
LLETEADDEKGNETEELFELLNEETSCIGLPFVVNDDHDRQRIK